jgi:aspartate ammonia-lyase
MPGKVNPVIPEVVNQIAFEVVGNDVTITFAAESGQLQLNAFEPIMAYSLFKSLEHLRAGCDTLLERCVRGISANAQHLQDVLDRSVALATALNPVIGYTTATAVTQEAIATGRAISEIVIDRGLLTPEQLEALLRPAASASAN